MRTIPFPGTTVSISRIGIGGWQAGGTGPWGGGPTSDDEQSIAAIRRAVEGGVTWVETAASYGLGHSEELIAHALRPWRVGEDVLVFTKCGHPWEPPDRIRTDLRPASIRRECEDSLRRLEVERIDLYHFHHADPSVPVEDSWSTMVDLVREGKVRWAGVSNFGVDLLERCEAVRHVDSVQPELSILRPASAAAVIPWCRDHGTAVIPYSPQAGGLLGGAWDRGALETVPEAKRGGLTVGALAGLLADLEGIATGLGASTGSLAIAWVLSTPGVTAAICGARRAAQVDGWMAASDMDLDAATIDAVGKAMLRAGIVF